MLPLLSNSNNGIAQSKAQKNKLQNVEAERQKTRGKNYLLQMKNKFQRLVGLRVLSLIVIEVAEHSSRAALWVM